MMTMKKFLSGEIRITRLLRALVLVYAVLFVIGACCPYRVIFQPPRASYQALAGQFMLPVGGSNMLACVYRPGSTNGYTLLYSHGNAEDIGYIEPLFDLYNQCGLGVVAYDYRSYGLSTGSPNEQNSYADIDALYVYTTNTLGIPPERIIAHGRSLGAAMALHIAATHEVGGLILESAFYTAYRVMCRVPLLPFDKFRNKDKIAAIGCPVFIMHGTADVVIRPWHGRALYERAHEPKMSWWVEGAGHNDLIDIAGEEYRTRLQQFVAHLANDFKTPVRN